MSRWQPATREARRLRNTRRYRQARAAFLASRLWCAACQRRGVTSKPAEHLDHIRPVESGGEFWDRENWQPLCRECHEKKTAAERRRYRPGWEAAFAEVFEIG